RRFNQDYGTDFPEPQRFATKGEYIPSLTGEGKMSKSVEGSFINLTDSLEEIQSKISKIPTDGGKGQEITGGVKSLVEFVKLFQGEERMSEIVHQYQGESVRYGDVKRDVSEAIYNDLKPLQEKRKELEQNPESVKKIIEEGAQKARLVAQKTI